MPLLPFTQVPALVLQKRAYPTGAGSGPSQEKWPQQDTRPPQAPHRMHRSCHDSGLPWKRGTALATVKPLSRPRQLVTCERQRQAPSATSIKRPKRAGGPRGPGGPRRAKRPKTGRSRSRAKLAQESPERSDPEIRPRCRDQVQVGPFTVAGRGQAPRLLGTVLCTHGTIAHNSRQALSVLLLRIHAHS